MKEDEKINEKKRKKSKKEGIKIKGTKTIRRRKEGRWKKETKRCRGEKRDVVRGFDFFRERVIHFSLESRLIRPSDFF